MASTEKYVYSFGRKGTDGDAKLRDLLGGKGANLAEMTKIGLPVPAGFTIGTNVCTYYYAHDRQYPPELRDAVAAAMAKIEDEMGAKFGSTTNPLLVSCRSGARESMPGMMDTVLNIGLNEDTSQGMKVASARLAAKACRERRQPPRQVVAEEVVEGAITDARLFTSLEAVTGGGNRLPPLQHQERHELEFEREVVRPLGRGLCRLDSERLVETGDVGHLL